MKFAAAKEINNNYEWKQKKWKLENNEIRKNLHAFEEMRERELRAS